MAYIGVSPSNGVRRKHTYTATASQTSFSGAGAEGATLSYSDSNYVDVYQNGVKLADEDYTATSGTAIVLAQGASADDIVEIIAFDVFSVADTVSKANGGTFDGNVTMAGSFGVAGKATAPSSPSAGDLWFNSATATVSGVVSTAMAVYNGSSWDQMSNIFSATGGTESTAGGYKYHTFTSSGTFTIIGAAGNVDYLIVAGGGGAGRSNGAAGAGAGGLLDGSVFVTEQSYSIVVGAGGAAANATSQKGSNGVDSNALGLTAIGGGGSGSEGGGLVTNGAAGGSGGGGVRASGVYGVGGSGTSGQGYAGGSNVSDGAPNYSGGGGGGASAAGTNGSASVLGNGGNGINWKSLGTYYAGGGAAGAYVSGNPGVGGTAGLGGGGLGGSNKTQAQLDGDVNTGGGGGGHGGASSNSGAGGSGIVIIRYAV
jgi:hypothetical protein